MKTVALTTQDPLVTACLLFQQGKLGIAQHLGNLSLDETDKLSRAIFVLKMDAPPSQLPAASVVKRKRGRPVGSFGPAIPMTKRILGAVQGLKTFTPNDITQILRKGALRKSPKAGVAAYVCATLRTHPTLFKRTKRGVYRLLPAAVPTKALKAPKSASPIHRVIADAVVGMSSFRPKDVLTKFRQQKMDFPFMKGNEPSKRIATLCGEHPETFDRLETGVYRLKATSPQLSQ